MADPVDPTRGKISAHLINNQPQSGVEGEAPIGFAVGGGDVSPYGRPAAPGEAFSKAGGIVPGRVSHLDDFRGKCAGLGPLPPIGYPVGDPVGLAQCHAVLEACMGMLCGKSEPPNSEDSPPQVG